MDVNAVLEGTLSPNAEVRLRSETQLNQAAEADFSGYLSRLAHELANDDAGPNIRVAAGLALKNSFSARNLMRLRQVQERWLTQIDGSVKTNVKALALKTLTSNDSRAGQAAAQFISAIAAIEIPRNMWPELMPTLVESVGSGAAHQKQASLTTIGYICEAEDQDLRESLAAHSNAILTAVIQGARKEEQNDDVRNAAITALSDSLEFVRSNFENEGERNYIMQVICEATQADDSRIQQGAYGCLNRIMSLYYDKMKFYMEKALFGLTVQGMRSEEEDVAKLAVEFWCTVCEEEVTIEDDNQQAQAEGSTELREYFNFARIATTEVVPVLLELLTKQDEDATDDEYNVSRAAYQCLQLWAQAVGNTIVQPVLGFVETHLRADDWHFRDAAVSAFGAILEGPDEKMLDPIVKQALPVLIATMSDSVVQVKDSAAYALGRICELCSESVDPMLLAPLITAFFEGLSSHPKMASSCCWALMNLAERFSGEPGSQQNALTPHFEASLTHLLQVTERPDTDNTLRTAAYEVLNAFVTNAANDSLQMVASLSTVILERLEKTIPLRQQVVSFEDKNLLDDMQTSLVSVMMAIIQRLEGEIKPLADRIMSTSLALLNSSNAKSSVPETVFAAIGALANSLEVNFLPYMEAFSPYLYKGLENHDEPSLCSMSIGLVSDITRALNEQVQPWCDGFMNRLLQDLQSQALNQQFKPAILQCFGDIAQAIGGHFEAYLPIVAQVLQQASLVNAGPDHGYEMVEYVASLREGIMDAWDGAIVAMKTGGKAAAMAPYVEHIFGLLHIVYQDMHRTEALLRSSMGVIGDISEAFPNGEFTEFFRQDWLSQMVKEARANRDYSDRTNQTARWAREQIKRQTGMYGAEYGLFRRSTPLITA
ncbi:ARM repeat-containing protein [Trichodelitschia bisporula]|uniref:Importin-95 n=1 Tax=Trichodelitschia bisporula TaxID=703511 RepID=A0A6G1HJP6_9PEZI|nr:ARM repeat-containing protein [Trichodelitschia bisporula]